MTPANTPDCVVIVSSFDGFADCWNHFDFSVSKYWPDCPWPIVLLTGEKTCQLQHVRIMQLGQDRGWAGNMIEALRRTDAEYVLYLQEDYWLSQTVKTDKLCEWLGLMKQNNWQYLRLNPCPPPDRILEDRPELGECLPDNKYRASLQAAFWNKQFFLRLLREGENGWDFEAHGRERAGNSLGTCFCVSAPVKDPAFCGINYCDDTAIRRGQWTRGAIHYARREGLTLNPARGRESALEEYLSSVSSPLPAKAAARALLRSLQVMKGQRRLRDFFT